MQDAQVLFLLNPIQDTLFKFLLRMNLLILTKLFKA